MRPFIKNSLLYQEVNCLKLQNILEEIILHNVKNTY